MSNTLFPFTRQQFFANNGTPLAGGLVYTYAAGTTTPQATYTASGATNTNPIVLDFRGSCDIWAPSSTGYKILVTDSSGNTIPGYPIDNIVVGPTTSGSFSAVSSDFAGTAISFGCYWVMAGPMVTVSIGDGVGTSNNNTFYLNSIPSIVVPPTLTQIVPLSLAENGGSVVYADLCLQINANSSTWYVCYQGASNGWTQTGTKGLVGAAQSFSYLLI